MPSVACSSLYSSASEGYVMKVRIVASLLVLSLLTGSAFANVVFVAALSGDQVEPDPVNTAGHGTASATHDASVHTLHVKLSYSDLSGPVDTAVIKCCAPGFDETAGEAINLSQFGFATGFTSGSFDGTIPLYETDTWSPNFLSDNGGTAELAHDRLVGGMLHDGTAPFVGIAYFEIATSMHPEGELRGNISAPEPATFVLLLSGLAAVAASRRRR